MSGEKQTVVVNPPTNGASENVSEMPVNRAIDQAEQFGAMRAEFDQTRGEVASIRSMLESDRFDKEALGSRLASLEAQQARLLEALEREEEENEETDPPSDSSTTVIVPPALETPKEEETPPKRKQSWMNRVLFGREEE